MDDFETQRISTGLVRAGLAAATLVLAACANVPWSPSLGFIEVPPTAAMTPPEPPPGEGAPRMTVAEFEAEDNSDAGELRLQSGDAVKLSFWGYPELDHLGIVQPNGSITVPLVGEIVATDKTIAELRTEVVKALQPYTSISTPDLRPGDVLSFVVWREEGLRHQAIVDPSGFATFPMVGKVKATGRPVEDIRVEAEKRLAEFLRDPHVSILPTYTNRRVLQDLNVSVLAHIVQPRRIAVIGEVGIMGMLDLKSGARIVDALAQTQINRSTAAINSIVVIRNSASSKPRYRQVRFEDFLEGRAPQENVALRHGDIVIVPKTQIAKVGEFVDLFFVKTLPVFQWWGVAWEASVSHKKVETVKLINDSLRRNLDSVVITPTPP